MVSPLHASAYLRSHLVRFENPVIHSTSPAVRVRIRVRVRVNGFI